MIANGQRIVFDVQGTTGNILPRSVASVRQAAIDALTPFFIVEDVSIDSQSALSDPLHSLSLWPYSATVRAVMQSDYADVRDIDSIVAHAFYQAAGEVPTVTAEGLEAAQGPANNSHGLGLTGALTLVAVGLIALAVIKVAEI
jgi:hypothetical protein